MDGDGVIDTVYVLRADGTGCYEPAPVDLRACAEPVKVYYSKHNALNYPELDLAQLAGIGEDEDEGEERTTS